MVQFSNSIETAVINRSEAMEAGDHFKNGASSKSQMSRRNFGFFYLILTATVIMFFAACNKDEVNSNSDSYVIIEENTAGNNALVIKAYNVENGNNDISSAKVTIGYQSSDKEWHYLEFSAKFENGGFELHLPATIPDEYLSPSSNVLLYEDGIVLSDIHAKNTMAMIHAHNSLGNIGGFSFSSGKWNMGFMYADRSYTEKGFSKGGLEYDCSYKKGWNIVYWYWNGTNSKKTTQKPKTEKFKCYFSYNTLG